MIGVSAKGRIHNDIVVFLEGFIRQKIVPYDVVACAPQRINEVGVVFNGIYIVIIASAHTCLYILDHIALAGTWFEDLDRKSTRLNSSHVAISYAVFCLK